MTSKLRTRALCLVLSLGLLLSACGPLLIAGIEGSGLINSLGVITAFGSVFVNGVEYTVAHAQIDVDEQPGTESQLGVGDVVSIEGAVNADGKTGSASRIRFSGNVRGPVASVNTSARSLVVLGQTVFVKPATVFDPAIRPAGLSGLPTGALIEVSGYPQADGSVVATRIRPASGLSALRVRGTVQALDRAALTFRINALTVDYSAAAVSTVPVNGSVVEVQGGRLDAGGALLASSVQAASTPAPAANTRGEVQGVITSLASSTDFVVNGVQVLASASTQYTLNGVQLAVGAHASVTGSFDSSGRLQATGVVLQAESDGNLSGVVQAVAATGLTVLGVNVAVAPSTAIEDEVSNQRPFGFADIRVGDFIAVGGVVGSGALLQAQSLVREAAGNSILRARPSRVAAPELVLIGITVLTDAATQFAGSDGQTTTAAQFFAQASNSTVRVSGTLNAAGQLLAAQAQIGGDE